MSGNVARKCTCLVDTESDSEEDTPVPTPTSSTTVTTMAGSMGEARGAPAAADRPATAATNADSGELYRTISGYRDSISTSTALHNSEALRQAHVLQNVFCACYDVETVVAQVQRRERMFSPVQVMLLRRDSIATVFRYATSLPDTSEERKLFHHRHPQRLGGGLARSGSGSGRSGSNSRFSRSSSSNSNRSSSMSSHSVEDDAHTSNRDPERYRRAFVATEIILKFYLKAMAWHGNPKTPPPTDSLNEQMPRQASFSMHLARPLQTSHSAKVHRRYSADASALSPTHRPLVSYGMTGKGKNGSKGKQSQLPYSGMNQNDVGHGSVQLLGVDAIDDVEIRGYVLRLEDLTEKEWTDVFGELFRFLWIGDERYVKSGSMDVIEEAGGEHRDEADSATEPPTLDHILVANLARIIKCFVAYPSVHRILAGIPSPNADSKETQSYTSWSSLISQLALYTYYPDIVSLLHGLIHLAQRRQYDVEQLVNKIVFQLSSVVLPHGVETNNHFQQQRHLQNLFHVKRPRIHELLTGCTEILTKILSQQFPNTFRYYIQSKVQLASYESVAAFERELYPAKIPPSDPSLHLDIKNAVMTALLEKPETLLHLSSLALAEIRFIDAYHDTTSSCSVPAVLVIDVIRCAIDSSFQDRSQLDLFVPCVQQLLDTLCAAINFDQHMSTISAFASRDCFSDSDSDEGDDDDGSEALRTANDESSKNQKSDTDIDDINNQNVSIPSAPKREDQGKLPSRIQPVDGDSLGTKLSTGIMPIVPAPVVISPTSGREIVNHRPLTSTLLILQVVDFLDAVIRMGFDSLDKKLTRLDASTSLINLFEQFPNANILHSRLLRLFLNLFDRSTTGRVNNPFLRSLFRPPNSLQEFIMKKLHHSSKTHPYDAHLAILGVKIDKICSAPSLQQEIIRQYCSSTRGWPEFCSSLVASHFQQMDALDNLAVRVDANGGSNHNTVLGRRFTDGSEDVSPLSRRSSSSCDFLPGELQPFRRLPVEKEGFGSAQNLAVGTDAVNPTDMARSRKQSQYPQSILDIMKNDTSTEFAAVDKDGVVRGFAYQKRAKWVKVELTFDKSNCQLICQGVSMASPSASVSGSTPAASSTSSPTGPHAVKKSSSLSTSKLKQLWMQHRPQWASRPRKFVVCNARNWIAFGRTVKHPNVGAFGFQIDVFDRIREEDQTLTFVTRSEATRTQWFEALNNAVGDARPMRNSFSDVDEDANIMLVRCVATQREGSHMVYLALPDVHVLGPVISSNFSLKSEVPEDIPFWGTFQGTHGVSKYCSLFQQCLRVVSVHEKSVTASGYSVIVDFDATLQAIDPTPSPPTQSPAQVPVSAVKPITRERQHLELQIPPVDHDRIRSVTCSFTDTYLMSGNQIIKMTRTIADSEKLVKILCDDVTT